MSHKEFCSQSEHTTSTCKLDKLFAMQATLNDHVFKSKNITDHEGNVLTMRKLMEDAKTAPLTARSVSIEWACRYLKALQAEAVETAEELPIKWWSNREASIESIREEVIDQLHFWISLAISVGMDGDSVFAHYMKKNEVNIQRIDTGYTERIKEGASHNV